MHPFNTEIELGVFVYGHKLIDPFRAKLDMDVRSCIRWRQHAGEGSSNAMGQIFDMRRCVFCELGEPSWTQVGERSAEDAAATVQNKFVLVCKWTGRLIAVSAEA